MPLSTLGAYYNGIGGVTGSDVSQFTDWSRQVVVYPPKYKAGDLVRAGEQVAKAGSTGRSTGAHVHFEVWENGGVVNPRKFLTDGRAPVAKRSRG